MVSIKKEEGIFPLKTYHKDASHSRPPKGCGCGEKDHFTIVLNLNLETNDRDIISVMQSLFDFLFEFTYRIKINASSMQRK